MTDTETFLLSLDRPIAAVGNAKISVPRGDVIESYSSVIRFNNFRVVGFEELVGEKTTARCTYGMPVIEVQTSVPEFSPFLRGSTENLGLETYEHARGAKIITPTVDVHSLLPSFLRKPPSTGFSFAVLCRHLGIPVALFGFDGFCSREYLWGQSHTGDVCHDGEGEQKALREYENITIFEP